MIARALRRILATTPNEKAVDDGLPESVAVIVGALNFFDRGIRDIETGERRVIAMTADGRGAFEASREGAQQWLRARWPSLSDEQVGAGLDLLHARMTSHMRQVVAQNSVARGTQWAAWRPLEKI